MSSSSSSETQDCREAATRPRPPRPRPRPRSGPGPGSPHPHQTESRPKQAYQTHTYLTEVHTFTTQVQNHQLKAQSDVRQNQKTKTQNCREGAIRPRPRSGPNTTHPHPPQTPALMQHTQAHQTQTQTQYRQAQPTQAQTTQAQTHKRQAPSHPTQAHPTQAHPTQAQPHQTQTQTQYRQAQPTQAQTHKRQAPTRPTQAQPHQTQTQQHHRESPVNPNHSPTSDSPRPTSDSPRPTSDSPRPTSASPPSHKAQTQDHTPHTRQTRQTQQHCRETTTSRSPRPPSPPFQESRQAHTQNQNQTRQTQQPRRDSTTSPSPRPTSDSSSSLEKHPRAVKPSPLPSPSPPASHHNAEPQRESPEERQTRTQTHKQMPQDVSEQQPSRPHCPEPRAPEGDRNNTPPPEPTKNNASFPSFVDVPGPCEPEDLIDGIIFAANYLGSTQLLSDKNPSKGIRMTQAQEAVSQVKSQDEDSQMVTEVDLFISTKAVKMLNADSQETLMDSALRSISYIADIGSIVVLMARTHMSGTSSQDCTEADLSSSEGQRQYRMICYVFESEDAQLIAQSIGQAFSVAYREFLRANGINPKDLSQKQYSDIINSQEMYNDDLVHFSNSDNCKELELEKQRGESLGVVIVESGWGSILPTVILANMLNSGPAARSGKLSVGDQIMSINNTSLVGLPLATCQGIIKGLKSQVQVKLSIVCCPPVTTVLIKRPDLKFQLGFSVQNGIICSLMRGGIAERGGVRVGHRIIEINGQSVVAMPHEKIVQTLSVSVGEINMKTMPAVMFRLLTGQEIPVYI
ncbi:amyloid-beta A4 precursor protein-binding family A member 2-like [Coregonus clupeaformis]|uniref:amyloid-beta A4 precursor protein-binding family A member 2-like n=1 Tax=Coregonus clupeaformis TaxID=59861 RepID=UPI001BE0B929|nr:amyloid-beta A4 precursor protein-binding family A member 2-like [Coregonus clupeaformis]